MSWIRRATVVILMTAALLGMAQIADANHRVCIYTWGDLGSNRVCVPMP